MPFAVPWPMLRPRQILVFFALAAAMVTTALAQDFLDPTRNLPVAPAPQRAALPEQYIWTEGDVTALHPDHAKFPWNRTDLRIAPHYFRAHFRIASLPRVATLYIAGPREAHVYLNGQLLDNFYLSTDAPIDFHVFHTSAVGALRAGDNVLAIEAVRGRGVVSATNSLATQQLAYGEILVAKIVPARFGTGAPPLMVSDTSWHSSAEKPSERWSEAAFDDSSWQPVASLGPVESNADFFQWSVDAGIDRKSVV